MFSHYFSFMRCTQCYQIYFVAFLFWFCLFVSGIVFSSFHINYLFIHRYHLKRQIMLCANVVHVANIQWTFTTGKYFFHLKMSRSGFRGRHRGCTPMYFVAEIGRLTLCGLRQKECSRSCELTLKIIFLFSRFWKDTSPSHTPCPRRCQNLSGLNLDIPFFKKFWIYPWRSPTCLIWGVCLLNSEFISFNAWARLLL